MIGLDGRPTTDPGAFPAGGALTPMAGHKGYGLALLIECLSAVLTGAAVTRQVGTWVVGDPSVSTGHGAAFVAVDIGSMMPIDEFKRRVDAMAEEIRQAPRAEGSDRIYLPGEMEWERRQKALSEGIVLPEDVRISVARAGEGSGHRSEILVRPEGPSPGTARFRLYNERRVVPSESRLRLDRSDGRRGRLPLRGRVKDGDRDSAGGVEGRAACWPCTGRCRRSAGARSSWRGPISAGLIHGACHTYVGQEAIAVGRLRPPAARRRGLQHAPRPRPCAGQGRAAARS